MREASTGFRPQQQRGRPRLPENQQRRVCVFVRVTESEHEALLKSARAVGLSVPSFVREVALQRRMKPSPSVIDLRAVQEMNRLGNNLNQLLILTHTHRAPAELSGTVERILALLSAIHGRVGDRREREME